MRRSNYNNGIYQMYEEELHKNEELIKEKDTLKLEVNNLKYELNYLKKSLENKMQTEINKNTSSLILEVSNLKEQLANAYKEIDRLKKEMLNKDYKVDKLECSINKNSSNSGIPTSKEVIHHKTGTNTYNHRTKSLNKNGGQFGHKGGTLTKEKIEKVINDNNINAKNIVHHINGKAKDKDIVKYKIGINVEMYVEKHIFKHTLKSKQVLPKEYYSDVTYNDDLKSLINVLGNYYSLGYSKVKELLYDLSNGLINISEGTIDNIYDEFSYKSEGTINNITTNLLNGKYQHTDETTTSENGKDTYYRGYANKLNALFKYHHNKGDRPIEEDNILTKYFGTIISDHEVGIFKYGTNNQDCLIHTGRYCIEGAQNVFEIEWQIDFYRFLLKLERERKILSRFGKKEFTKEEIELIENEYDSILKNGEEQNKGIASKYWREKMETFLRRLKKYKNTTLFFIHDFDIPSDNNFMERALRMIKGKTKVSGGFRSSKGGERFGNIMSIIKTAKLRELNPLKCIKQIFQGKSLFA